MGKDGKVQSISILIEEERVRNAYSDRPIWSARLWNRFMELQSDAYRYEIQKNDEDTCEWWTLKRCCSKSGKRIRRRSP